MTFMTRNFLLLSTLIAFTSLGTAHAEDAKKGDAKKTEKTESVLKKETTQKTPENTPVTKWMDAENALIDPLSDKNKESFFILRNKYSVIRVVGVVKRDVGAAVKACGKNNPDMKDQMESRFKQWQGAVDPIIDTAKKTFDKDLESQKTVDVKDARKVLKLSDEAFEYSDKLTTKQPVTSKQACQGLLASMDRTEDKMIGLLEATLLPETVLKQKHEQSLKEKAKAKATGSSAPAAPAAEKTKAE